MQINNRTQLNLVIGYPLEHTQSPLLHNALYAHLNLNAVLLAKAHVSLAPLLKSIKTLQVGLTAVTMPFKEKVLKYVDHVSDEVKELQAANTLIQRNQTLYAYNTDVAGIDYALQNVTLRNKKILIIGAGGAARAAAYLLRKKKAKIFWLNRTKRNALKLINAFGGTLLEQSTVADTDIDIIINTTPIGMHPHKSATPLPHYQFHAQQTVLDMVYNPMETILLKAAKKQRATTISGLQMFIGQGLRQVELWRDKSFTLQERSALIKTLQLLLK